MKKQKGITLIELLIAVSIFAVTVVLVVGSFGISTKNQREIRVNRDTSQDLRYVMQEIARQVEYSQNGTMRTKDNRPIVHGDHNVYNFAVVASPNTGEVGGDMTPYDTLYVRGADNHCRYYREEEERVVVYIDKNEGCDNPDFQGPYYLTDDKIKIKSLKFKGITNEIGKNRQAYVYINLGANNNQDYSEFNVPLHTSTLATIRNYSREN
jgi:prepilin-type N-terminal cleavage/methylation domain-containing protein